MIMNTASAIAFDPKDLEAKVKAMYRDVAENPKGEFHFEMGRALAERLGYPPADLDRIPAESIESFAGVGYFFHLADVKPGEAVVDLGSGSGMDTFIAALKVGSEGKVVGVDMTDEQRVKAERLRDRDGFKNVTYVKGYIENVPLPDASVDVVISNGVVNLATGQGRGRFREAVRLLKPGGRLAPIGYRDRSATVGKHRLQFHAVGGLHRRGRAARQLSSSTSRPPACAGGQIRRQSRLSVHFGEREGRQQEVRSRRACHRLWQGWRWP
jgi:SAM-dependent methyltransferase